MWLKTQGQELETGGGVKIGERDASRWKGSISIYACQCVFVFQKTKK